ncbi:Low density lipoprotein receptor adapter protein 1 [Triplophysa tibetana]|uniref:Low density lipoprotein receptor adapter protein 1 n=1 Tax=Triplophysa tibetana TaxID=1572043 RepID=A0A5A9PB98_9TELE|nr:Low density lipoprotein receptor adapter protein 1 [Triplophysa tibetana]
MYSFAAILSQRTVHIIQTGYASVPFLCTREAPPTHGQRHDEGDPLNLHTRPRPARRECYYIHTGSSAKRRKITGFQKSFPAVRGSGSRDQARGRPRPEDYALFYIIDIISDYGRVEISRACDHSQSQSGETVVDLWKT